MILSLRIHQLALIQDLTIDFLSGMHVMTGETGAGKSIVVDAVNLALGGRADRDLIRSGTDKAWVEAVFDHQNHPQVLALLDREQLETDGSTVTLYREITATGRNLCRVCGTVMPVSFLKEVAACLMDIHGQHEHQFLMDPAKHMNFLDASGDEKHQKLMADTAAACEAFLQNHRQYVKLVRENEQKNARMAELKKSLEELEKARLKPGEEEALTAEKERFRQGEKLHTVLSIAYQAMDGEGLDDPVLSRVKEASAALAGIRDLGEPFSALAARCESVTYELEELSYDLSALLSAEEYDPQRAEQVETRLDLIHRLERKYGSTIREILENKEQMQEEYDRFSSMDEAVAAMSKEHRSLLSVYRGLSQQLTESRKEAARIFEKKIAGQLADLGMGKTVFQVCFAPKPEGAKPTLPRSYGDDVLEFMISPNPGEPLKPLSRIASGGELSRLMLAIKSLEAEKGGVGTMVFDEIDTGISGRMAQVVAEKMAAIAQTRQVICVTHLPQLAAMADHQFLVEKSTAGDRTNSSVRMLTPEERVDEVARMLGGAGDVDESARTHARHMLKQAEDYRKGINLL